MAAFRFALQVSRTPRSAAAWRDLARKAEDLGYSTLYVPDHLDDQWAPMIALAVAAEATTTLRVGTLVLDNDFRHPVLWRRRLPPSMSMTGGRFELGLGAGWMRADYDAIGDPVRPARRAHRAAGRETRDHARHVADRQRHLRGCALPRHRRGRRTGPADPGRSAAGHRRRQPPHPGAGRAPRRRRQRRPEPGRRIHRSRGRGRGGRREVRRPRALGTRRRRRAGRRARAAVLDGCGTGRPERRRSACLVRIPARA